MVYETDAEDIARRRTFREEHNPRESHIVYQDATNNINPLTSKAYLEPQKESGRDLTELMKYQIALGQMEVRDGKPSSTDVSSTDVNDSREACRKLNSTDVNDFREACMGVYSAMNSAGIPPTSISTAQGLVEATKSYVENQRLESILALQNLMISNRWDVPSNFRESHTGFLKEIEKDYQCPLTSLGTFDFKKLDREYHTFPMFEDKILEK